MTVSRFILFTMVFSLALPALAQRQLRCEPEQECSITCYQDGMDDAQKIFHRENIDLLQVDLNARVLKVDFRKRDNKSTAYDYFILGSEMSCTIENMRGMHD